MCLYQSIISIVIISTLHNNDYDEKLADFYNVDADTMSLVAYIAISITLATQICIIIFLVDLIILHIWLYKHDLTTFEYITYLKEKKINPDLQLDFQNIKISHKSKVIKPTKNLQLNNIENEEIKTTNRGTFSAKTTDDDRIVTKEEEGSCNKL